MGILSWWKGTEKPTQPSSSGSSKPDSTKPEVAGMKGAVEVPRPAPVSGITIFEFGSVANSTDKFTLAGYCPVSDELEPCRWEVLQATDSDAPQFRIVF